VIICASYARLMRVGSLFNVDANCNIYHTTGDILLCVCIQFGVSCRNTQFSLSILWCTNTITAVLAVYDAQNIGLDGPQCIVCYSLTL